jgi:hypothetical protein
MTRLRDWVGNGPTLRTRSGREEWGTHYFCIADEVVALAAAAGWEFGELFAVARGGAGFLPGTSRAFFFGGAHGFGALQFQFHVEFGTFADGSTVAEAEVGDLGLEGELERVKQGGRGFHGNALINDSVLDFHDGDQDGFGAVEEREVDAAVLICPHGAA